VKEWMQQLSQGFEGDVLPISLA
jgi:hypothetical protein